jgi:hypothetical protein
MNIHDPKSGTSNSSQGLRSWVSPQPIGVWLIRATGSATAPSYYLTAAAIVSLVSLLMAHRFGQDRGQEPGQERF